MIIGWLSVWRSSAFDSFFLRIYVSYRSFANYTSVRIRCAMCFFFYINISDYIYVHRVIINLWPTLGGVTVGRRGALENSTFLFPTTVRANKFGRVYKNENVGRFTLIIIDTTQDVSAWRSLYGYVGVIENEKKKNNNNKKNQPDFRK